MRRLVFGTWCSTRTKHTRGMETRRYIHFAFFNHTETRYSVNEAELLGVVWSMDYFKIYFNCIDFTVITNHRDLPSILKELFQYKNYFVDIDFTVITVHKDLLSTLKEQRSDKS